ncbi:FAD/NAD(P)-binding oxidoreductase [Sphaerotilus sp.]|uniref:FAD/NAD(P)-binding oxidoreductase n=1 Tax=Sphaerotilus sp. TaxID=2093942 RepID=UPI002ACDA8B8|nr:FAD/NAD(P)-binding oxidoreductase [Sphaerotilus sp.]MDZ7854906.1 FAD/NAD(P)-binding oxidoreductase [Sphaerotilus sp.]
MQRRHLLQGLIAGGTLGLTGCASLGGTSASKAKVLVIGGGYGGATASKYIRLLSDYTIDVMMVEPNRQFVSCPVSNLVIGGQRTMADITNPYTGLSGKHGVRIVHDMVTSVDPVKKTATLAGGTVVQYDKLVLSPGIDFMWDQTEGLQAAHASGQILHAWKAGAETMALRQQLEAMRDGGTYAITIPEAPYRCPPGPYERASVIAAYFKKAKPKSKVLILDGNPDVTSKGPLFKRAWNELYGNMVEYRPQHKVTAVDAKNRTIKFEIQDDVKADVLNVLPVMRAGALAVQTGLANANARWCHVNFLNFESTAAKDIHVIGDAIQIAQGMPKSGHMANSHAKVASAAIVAELQGLEVNPHPMLTNVCMSFVDETHAIHVASVHEYQAPKKSFFTIGGSGGVSDARSDLESRYADAWARNIWADMLT